MEKKARWHVYFYNNFKNNWVELYEFYLLPTIALIKDHSFNEHSLDVVFEWLCFRFIISRCWNE